MSSLKNFSASLWLKKEYKKVTGESISLSKDPDSEVEVIVQNTSRVRTFVQAKRLYNIGGLGDVKQVVEDAENPAQRDASFKSFLDQGGFGKRAPNDNRKKAEWNVVSIIEETELIAEELRLASKHISNITSFIDNEDVLDKIFSSFCIGK